MIKRNLITNTSKPEEVVQAFMVAWERSSVDDVLATLSDDVVFVGTTGPEPGRAFRGKTAFKKVLEQLLSPQSTISLKTLSVHPAGENVFVVWETTDRAADARLSKMLGVDIFRVVNGKIVLKDAYRKSY